MAVKRTCKQQSAAVPTSSTSRQSSGSSCPPSQRAHCLAPVINRRKCRRLVRGPARPPGTLTAAVLTASAPGSGGRHVAVRRLPRDPTGGTTTCRGAVRAALGIWQARQPPPEGRVVPSLL